MLYIPPTPGNDEQMFRYHMAQSVGVVGIWFVAWLVGFWLIGRVPFIPQVAWAEQVQQVSMKVDKITHDNTRIWDKLTDIQILQIRAGIEQQLKTACLAKRSHNQADLDNANSQISQLTDSYYQMSGRPFSLPSCTTILVDGK